MKILWMSDSPTAPSGYGNIAREVCAGLAAHGHNVSILGWQSGRRGRWRGCRIYPIGNDLFGGDVLLDTLRRAAPDVLITTADAWRVFYIANARVGRVRRELGIPWVLYHGIDSSADDGGMPPSLALAMRSVDLPLSMSRFGAEVTRACGAEGAYVPVGVDLDCFRPPLDKTRAKRRWGYDGKFVVLADARNQPRKLLPRTLDVFRCFAAGKRDVILHLHCDPDDPAARSEEYRYRIREDVALLGLEGKVVFTERRGARGLTMIRLAGLYQAADVHLLTSYGEGFGLPTLQAAATGVVPLAGDYSASAELVRGHGEAVPIRHFVPGPLGLRMGLLDTDAAVDRLERLYQDRELLAEKSLACREFARSYAWPEVVRQWMALLEQEVPRLRAALPGRLSDDGVPTCLRERAAGPDRMATPVDAKTEEAAARLEAVGGFLAAEFVRDGARYRGEFTLPVVLPPPAGPLGVSRVMGRIYTTGSADLEVFHRLRAIFPGLTAVAAASVERLSVDDALSREEGLRTSNLALDVAGCDPDLPADAARAGVPCISPCNSGAQAMLWPQLALPGQEAATAVELGRWMLTDQGAALEFCAGARLGLETEQSRYVELATA